MGLGSLAAYTFSRFRFKGDKLLFLFCIAVRLVPPIALLVPFYLLLTSLGLYDNLLSLILCYTYLNMPFAIWLMWGFFKAIPREIDEAAKIDGCSDFEAFWRIILPVAKTSVAATCMFVFLMAWSDFQFALVLTSTTASKTFTMGICDFFADVYWDWGSLTAAGVMGMIPVSYTHLTLPTN